MLKTVENCKKCPNGCENCIYYFELTHFCLHRMYTAKYIEEFCFGFKDKSNYSKNDLILDTDLEFDGEVIWDITENTTLGELFEEQYEIHKAYFEEMGEL